MSRMSASSRQKVPGCVHLLSGVRSRTHLMHTNINLTTSRAWSMIAGRHGMAPLPSILETTQ